MVYLWVRYVTKIVQGSNTWLMQTAFQKNPLITGDTLVKEDLKHLRLITLEMSKEII